MRESNPWKSHAELHVVLGSIRMHNSLPSHLPFASKISDALCMFNVPVDQISHWSVPDFFESPSRMMPVSRISTTFERDDVTMSLVNSRC